MPRTGKSPCRHRRKGCLVSDGFVRATGDGNLAVRQDTRQSNKNNGSEGQQLTTALALACFFDKDFYRPFCRRLGGPHWSP